MKIVLRLHLTKSRDMAKPFFKEDNSKCENLLEQFTFQRSILCFQLWGGGSILCTCILQSLYKVLSELCMGHDEGALLKSMNRFFGAWYGCF